MSFDFQLKNSTRRLRSTRMKRLAVAGLAMVDFYENRLPLAIAGVAQSREHGS